MFIGEYDYDEDMAVKAEEAREEGLAEGREEGLAEGLEKGARENALENARKLYINGVSIDIISKSLGISVEEVRKIVKDLSVEKA